MSIRVEARDIPLLLVEESRLFREALKHILVGTRYTVQAEANSLEEAMELLSEGPSPELVILNFREKDESVVEGMRRLRARLPTARIVVLSFDVSVSKLVKAVEAGADAYLCDMPLEALVQSLTLVMLGQKIYPPNVAQMAIDARLGGAGTAKAGAGGLSEREIQILQHLVKGDPNKVIAHRLNVTEAAVKLSLQGILRKIKASNRTQAAIWAMEQGIVRSPTLRPLAS